MPLSRPPRERPFPRRDSLERYGKLAFLLVCTTIGCYLPATIGPLGNPPRDGIPPSPMPTAPPLVIPPPGNIPPAGNARTDTNRPPESIASETLTLTWQPQSPLHDWKYIVLHHTATDSGSVDSIDRTHRERTDASGNPWRGIGYHFVIGNGNGMADGEIQPTFRWLDQSAGAHAGNAEYNSFGIGICLVGNFEVHPPTPAQLAAARRLVAELKAVFEINSSAVLRHGDVKATECPGRLFPYGEIATATLTRSRSRL